MTIYGYCRSYTKYQKITCQINNILKAYPEIKLNRFYCDLWTTKGLGHHKWDRLLEKLETGDTIVFDSIYRMNPNVQECFDLYNQLCQRGISLVFIKESILNTTNYSEALKSFGSLRETVLRVQKRQFFQAFEQAEKARQKFKDSFTPEVRYKMAEGAKAKKGRKFVTKKSLETKPKIKRLSKEFDGDLSDKEVLKILDISLGTFYKYKKELKAELGQ